MFRAIVLGVILYLFNLSAFAADVSIAWNMPALLKGAWVADRLECVSSKNDLLAMAKSKGIEYSVTVDGNQITESWKGGGCTLSSPSTFDNVKHGDFWAGGREDGSTFDFDLRWLGSLSPDGTRWSATSACLEGQSIFMITTLHSARAYIESNESADGLIAKRVTITGHTIGSDLQARYCESGETILLTLRRK